jgi:hypothetical protein
VATVFDLDHIEMRWGDEDLVHLCREFLGQQSLVELDLGPGRGRAVHLCAFQDARAQVELFGHSPSVAGLVGPEDFQAVSGSVYFNVHISFLSGIVNR